VFGGTEEDTRTQPSASAEVPLSGLLSEFREALRAEIEAARYVAQGGAVQLVHGERIGRVADGHQYVFRLESAQLALPDDLPGDLYVPGRERVDANVVSLAGSTLTLSVADDLGAYVPRASLASNLTNLLRKLISRIEAISSEGRENPAGARLLGDGPVSGSPVEGLALDLNREQTQAVASGLGRDTTFIQGPPGTGKTRTIGALGEQFARAGRTLLLVSHTNSAVDQALLHIARALGPDIAAAGKVLRLGAPKDERVAAQPDLLVSTHVERRSASLLARRDELQHEQETNRARLRVVGQLVATCEWSVGAVERLTAMERSFDNFQVLTRRVRELEADVSAEEARVGRWESVRAEARAAQAHVEARPALGAAVEEAAGRLELAVSWRHQAEDVLSQEAEEGRVQVRGETRQVVVAARAALEGAKGLKREHQAQLATAREAVLMRGRRDELPPAAYTRAQVQTLGNSVADKRTQVEAARREHAAASLLLGQTQKANAVTRRLRRLPRPEEHVPVVASARERMLAHDAELATSRTELRVAEQRLAETERLDAALRQSWGLPSVKEAEALIEQDEQAYRAAISALATAEAESNRRRAKAARDARAHVRDGLARADSAFQEAERRVETARAALRDTDAAIERFAATHNGPPADLIVQADEALQQLDVWRHEETEARERLKTVERELREMLEAERGMLSRIGRSVSITGDLRSLVTHIGRTVETAMNQARSEDIDALRLEEAGLRSRIRDAESESAQIDEQLQAIEAGVIAGATVLATTLTRAYLRDEVQTRRFDTVILDEASMAPIPALWVAAAVAERNVVIVGDPRQLPPIALAGDDRRPEAPASKWLARDIFTVSRALDGSEHLVSLRTQYRMHPDISALPNALVYNGELNDAESTTIDDGLVGWYKSDWGHDAPVLRIDTENADAWCSTVVSGGRPSRLNFLSATLVAQLAERLLLEDREPPASGEARIIIATPYRPQARLITLLLREAGVEGEVVAGTVHSLQGSEAPVVIYDLVVDDPHRRAGMFSPQWDDNAARQFNVGLTRARHRLFIVGDFRFLATNGKKSFVGRLLRQLESSPRVEAEAVAPSEFSARAAGVRARVFGQDGEADRSDRLIVTQAGFDELFVPDLTAARQRIVIYSPFITQNRLEAIGVHLRAAVERDVSVYVVTKPLNDRNSTEMASYRELTQTLQRWGVIVVPKKAMHEKLIFIDDEIVWVGSLNPLSFRQSREIMERRRSRKIADDYRTTLQLDITFSAYEQGERKCPVCGSEMALAEGDRGTYRRCVVPGCYSRNLADPPLQDGKMACHACGGELYYGTWGERPAWRCRENPKHRMYVHANHLKLPAMTALLSQRELRQLHRILDANTDMAVTATTDGQTTFSNT
jgi:hypothetical protein